jgi:hypothetical protein
MAYRGTVYRLGTSQSVAYTDTAAASTNAFGVGTQVVRLSSTTGCHVRFGASPTAVATDSFLKGGEPEYFVVTPGQKVSAIRTTTSGTLTVTECSG